MCHGAVGFNRLREAGHDHLHNVLVGDVMHATSNKVAVVIDVKVITKKGKDVIDGVIGIGGDYRRASVEDCRRTNQRPVSKFFPPIRPP